MIDDLRGAFSFVLDPGNWTGETSKTALSSIGEELFTHTWISLVALLGAMLLGLPLSLWLGHLGRGGFAAVNLSNAGRAVPTLAVLILLIFGPFDSTQAALGALLLFALPPLVTNAYVGMTEVDRDTKEAALGMGMTGWQLFRRVELPLAAPLVTTGIRTAAVQVVATTTLAAVVGTGGLGRYVVGGFGRQDYEVVYAGVILVVAYALVVDQLMALVQRVTKPTGKTGSGTATAAGTEAGAEALDGASRDAAPERQVDEAPAPV